MQRRVRIVFALIMENSKQIAAVLFRPPTVCVSASASPRETKKAMKRLGYSSVLDAYERGDSAAGGPTAAAGAVSGAAAAVSPPVTPPPQPRYHAARREHRADQPSYPHQRDMHYGSANAPWIGGANGGSTGHAEVAMNGIGTDAVSDPSCAAAQYGGWTAHAGYSDVCIPPEQEAGFGTGSFARGATAAGPYYGNAAGGGGAWAPDARPRQWPPAAGAGPSGSTPLPYSNGIPRCADPQQSHGEAGWQQGRGEQYGEVPLGFGSAAWTCFEGGVRGCPLVPVSADYRARYEVLESDREYDDSQLVRFCLCARGMLPRMCVKCLWPAPASACWLDALTVLSGGCAGVKSCSGACSTWPVVPSPEPRAPVTRLHGR